MSPDHRDQDHAPVSVVPANKASRDDRWVIQENRLVVPHCVKPLVGHLPVVKMATADVDDLYWRRCGRDDGGPLASSTARRIHAVLDCAFAEAGMGVGVVQPGVERVSATSGTSRDLSTPGPRRECLTRARSLVESGVRHVPTAGDVDRCPAQPTARVALGRDRLRTPGDRVHRGIRRGSRRPQCCGRPRPTCAVRSTTRR
jgi:hypothetical protein